MGPTKRPNAGSFSHALTADKASKRRRLPSPRVPDVSQPASGPLPPTHPFSDQFEVWATLREQMPPATAEPSSNYSNSLRNSLENILWSDDYETHEASRVAATMAEYGAMLAGTDSAAPDPPDPDQSHQGDLLEDILWSDDYETHEASRVAATMAQYEALLLNGDLADSSIERDQAGNNSTPVYAKQRFGSRPNYYLTSEMRQAILSSFKNNPNKSIASIANEFGVSSRTISRLRERFNKTGNIGQREVSRRLTAEERQALLNIFKDDSERSNESIAIEFGFSTKTILLSRKRFNKTGNIEQRESSRRLTAEERRAILNIFENDSQKSNASIADEFGFSNSTIAGLRNKFRKTGNIELQDSPKRLTAERRQAVLNTFKKYPQKSTSSIATEFNVSPPVISSLRKRFNRRGNIEPVEIPKRLTPEERQAISNIFKNNSERSSESIADEFGSNVSTIAKLKRQFRKTGSISPRNMSRRLTFEERQAILNIFKNDSERSNESIACEFSYNLSTIIRLRKQFSETGNVDRGDSSRHMTNDQRLAILNIFKNHSEKNNASIASDFGFDRATIARLRKQFRETGNIDLPKRQPRR